ncbi:hypothetical protein [Streptomyces inusitatus]|uniref:hypothetical protein n=1 Tax=Streptomyces inusitatus TaxID=68221 RepID=UPI00167DC68B|nr:hypothetical protein [Streptomyces inusitatus]
MSHPRVITEAPDGDGPCAIRFRRAVTALMIAGLLGSMVLLIVIGSADAFAALTFAGRVTGFLFVASGLIQGAAAAAAFDYWGKRRWKHSGAVTLTGALIALFTSGLLVFLWFEEREYTPYALTYFPLFCWSLWALWLLGREKAWRGIPHPKGFAAGVTATALLASTNLAYSAVYQPYSLPVQFAIDITFGNPVMGPGREIINLPVTIRTENTGKVASYILNSSYQVMGRSAAFEGNSSGLTGWKTDVKRKFDAERYVGPAREEIINTGPVIRAGTWLETGDVQVEQRVAQIPADAGYDLVRATTVIALLRKDRGKIGPEFEVPRHSWDPDQARFFECPPECEDQVLHSGRVVHNNNIVNVTREPRHVYSRWTTGKGSTRVRLTISPADSKGKASADDESYDQYGVFWVGSGVATVPFAALTNPAPE